MNFFLAGGSKLFPDIFFNSRSVYTLETMSGSIVRQDTDKQLRFKIFFIISTSEGVVHYHNCQREPLMFLGNASNFNYFNTSSYDEWSELTYPEIFKLCKTADVSKVVESQIEIEGNQYDL